MSAASVPDIEDAGRELSMTTVFKDDLIRIQVLRRKLGKGNSQGLVSLALDVLEGKRKAAP